MLTLKQIKRVAFALSALPVAMSLSLFDDGSTAYAQDEDEDVLDEIIVTYVPRISTWLPTLMYGQ